MKISAKKAGMACRSEPNALAIHKICQALKYVGGENRRDISGGRQLTLRVKFDILNIDPNDMNHDHAVTNMSSGENYSYDANGNQTQRVVGGNTYNLTYDAENRLVGVNWGVTATFTYDGDGNRVKGEITGGDTTIYIGKYVEWIEGADYPLVKYYYAGNTRVAMRSDSLKFLLGDHLGSTSITTNSSGGFGSEIRYYPWGGMRYTSGSSPTTFQFTGQRLESDLGLLFYNARWYDPSAGRFIQADTMVPGGVQGLDRYAYVNNNPLNLIDPTGHGGTAPKKTSPMLPPPILPPSDATLISFSGTIGVGPWFLSGGIDIVVTDDEIGVFQIKAAGPQSGGSELSGSTGASEDATWVTPQFGGSGLIGPIWGSVVNENVSNYEGTTLVAGGSLSPVAGELFTSTDPTYGVINYDFNGYAVGPTFGLAPLEAHIYYTNAINLEPVSNFLTSIGRALGLLDEN